MSAGKTISIAFWKGWDDPGYGKEWDLSSHGYGGLSFIPGGKSVFPHYAAHEHESLVQSKQPDLGHEVVVLSEEDAYVVEGSREYILKSTGQVCSAASNTRPRSLPASKSFGEPSSGQSFSMPPGSPVSRPATMFELNSPGNSPSGVFAASPWQAGFGAPIGGRQSPGYSRPAMKVR
jgi:hypothetical protein